MGWLWEIRSLDLVLMVGLPSILRATGRFLHFGASLAGAGLDFAWNREHRSVLRRARWMQRWSRRLLRSLGIRVEIVLEVDGQVQPSRAGLVVSNHLGYIDILVLGAQQPLVFVSKSEVRHWPILGAMVGFAGTIFLERRRRADLSRVTAAIRAVVDGGVSVAFFPEGTSTDGSYVGAFHAGLFDPAVTQSWSVIPAWIDYRLADGSVASAVSYWGDMIFLPHFLKLLTQPPITARIVVGGPMPQFADRKQLASATQQVVSALSYLPTNLP